MIILPPCIADFNILFNETAFFLQRYFIRFDRLILLSRVVHIATHVSTVTSCIELWFPTSASVASPPFFFFLSFSPSLVLFLSLLRVSFSSSSSFFFSILFYFFFFFMSRRYYAAKMIEFRCVALVAQLKPTPPSIPKRNFQAFCSKRRQLIRKGDGFFAFFVLILNDTAFVVSFCYFLSFFLSSISLIFFFSFFWLIDLSSILWGFVIKYVLRVSRF